MQIVWSESPNAHDDRAVVARPDAEITVAAAADGYWQVRVDGRLTDTCMTRRGALRAARRYRTPPERVDRLDVRPGGGGYWLVTTPAGTVLVSNVWGRGTARREARRLSTPHETVAGLVVGPAASPYGGWLVARNRTVVERTDTRNGALRAAARLGTAAVRV